MQINTDSFKNFTVISHHIPTAKTAAVGIWLQNGARFEQVNESGYAHFLEHLLFKRTRKHTGQELSTLFERMGGHINAETGRELTAFHGVVPAHYSNELLRIYLDMLTAADFNEQDFTTERDVVLQELAMLRDDPEEALEDFATEQSWPDHPAGRQILGNVQSLKSSSCASMHQYLHNVLGCNTLYVIAVGNVDHDAIVSLCKQAPAVTSTGKTENKAPVFSQLQAALDIKAEQKHLAWLMPTVAYSDERHACCELANHILAGGYDSCLYQALREEHGLVYSIDSRVDSYSDTGLWFIQTNTDKDQVTQTVDVVQQTIEKLIDNGPTQKQLDNARQHIQSSLILEQDDLEALMEKIARDSIYLGRISSLEEQLDAVSNLTTTDIQQALQRAWNQASHYTTL